METRFIADNNVGKLARWLRMMGYDTVLCRDKDDREMVRRALDEDRVILTKDSQFMRRRLIASGRLKAVLVKHDDPEEQVREVVKGLALDYCFGPFSLCLECNRVLSPRSREEVRERVPLHVFRTQPQYTECVSCRRVYWQGTHWRAMIEKLEHMRSERDW